ncbi:MAG: DUF2892 domain-containing protein [Patescibacteria group bacterium]|nr:DUF2892 domain-containing protein [Patescibacteria group bacterium]
MKLKKNIGKLDRKIRIILGSIIILISILIDSTLRWFFLGLGLIMIITALIGICGFYTSFGINTCKFDKK